MRVGHRRSAWVGACAVWVCGVAGAASTISGAAALERSSAPAPEAAVGAHETGAVFANADDLTFREGAAPNQDAGGAEGPAEDPEAWDFKWELGFAFSSGNTDSQSLQTALRAKKERKQIDRFQGDAQYFWLATDGDNNTNRLTVGGRYDYFINQTPLFVWVNGRYDYDEFQSWDQRVAFHVGLGYDIVRQEDLTLTLLGGLGSLKEFGGDNEDWSFEGLLGLDLGWKISERQSLAWSSRFFPNFSESGEYRLTNTAAWSMKLDEWDGVSLNVGLFQEYQSDVDPGRENNDLRIFGGFAIDF